LNEPAGKPVRLLRYIAVTGSALVVNVAVFVLLRAWELPTLLCGALSYAAACRHGSTWHARLAGRLHAGAERPRLAGRLRARAQRPRSARFALASLAMLGMNFALPPLLESAGLHPLIAQCAAFAAACPLELVGSREHAGTSMPLSWLSRKCVGDIERGTGCSS
jgi:putative flippase GtrA